MRRNILCTVLLAALLGAGLTGCGDSETKLFIQPFFGSPIELQVNQEINIDM